MNSGRWKHTQNFQIDVEVSVLQWDPLGDFLACGDTSGKIWIFCSSLHNKCSCYLCSSHTSSCSSKVNNSQNHNYPIRQLHYFLHFQSHSNEFDILKNIAVESCITSIQWCPRSSPLSFLLLVSNSRSIKCWRISSKKTIQIMELNCTNNENNFFSSFSSNSSFSNQYSNLDLDKLDGLNSFEFNSIIHSPPPPPPSTSPAHNIFLDIYDSSQFLSLNLPKYQILQRKPTPRLKRRFQTARLHPFKIHSLSMNVDGELFLSSDDFNISLWNLGYPNGMRLLELENRNLEQLSEVITCARFHPILGNQFLYTTSKGRIYLGDLRIGSTLSSTKSQILETSVDFYQKNDFFLQILSSISFADFSSDGRFIFSRDYNNLKVWDVHYNSTHPIAIVPIHAFLTKSLPSLYQNDHIFDRFDLSISHNGQNCVSGSYHRNFVVFNGQDGHSQMLFCGEDEDIQAKNELHDTASGRDFYPPITSFAHNISPHDANFNLKVSHSAWHPKSDLFCISVKSLIFIYQLL